MRSLVEVFSMHNGLFWAPRFRPFFANCLRALCYRLDTRRVLEMACYSILYRIHWRHASEAVTLKVGSFSRNIKVKFLSDLITKCANRTYSI